LTDGDKSNKYLIIISIFNDPPFFPPSDEFKRKSIPFGIETKFMLPLIIDLENNHVTIT
jgi:hypothetical protein